MYETYTKRREAKENYQEVEKITNEHIGVDIRAQPAAWVQKLREEIFGGAAVLCTTEMFNKKYYVETEYILYIFSYSTSTRTQLDIFILKFKYLVRCTDLKTYHFIFKKKNIIYITYRYPSL